MLTLLHFFGLTWLFLYIPLKTRIFTHVQLPINRFILHKYFDKGEQIQTHVINTYVAKCVYVYVLLMRGNKAVKRQ